RLRIARLNPRYHFRAASECSALISSYKWARSRSARAVRLTAYAMRGFEVREKLPRRPELALLGVLQALTDSLLGIGTRCDVEQLLVGCGVLHDGRRPALHGQ